MDHAGARSRARAGTPIRADAACNFAREERRMETARSELVLATNAGVRLEDGAVVLPALAGAVLR